MKEVLEYFEARRKLVDAIYKALEEDHEPSCEIISIDSYDTIHEVVMVTVNYIANRQGSTHGIWISWDKIKKHL